MFDTHKIVITVIAVQNDPFKLHAIK